MCQSLTFPGVRFHFPAYIFVSSCPSFEYHFFIFNEQVRLALYPLITVYSSYYPSSLLSFQEEKKDMLKIMLIKILITYYMNIRITMFKTCIRNREWIVNDGITKVKLFGKE